MPTDHRAFLSIAHCDPSDRESHSAAADLDGTLLVSRSSFPYFLLLAVEAGSLLRGLALLLVSPLVLLIYKLVSESAGIQILIYVSVSGIRMRDIELASRAVLPRFYAANVRSDSWRAFRACGRRRVVVTANPTMMVEPFVREYLGGDLVLGTDLEVDEKTGKATGFVAGKGVLVGPRKREAVVREFGEELPDLGLGDRESDHDFMELCKEAYMVNPDRSAARVPVNELVTTTTATFHDGRFVQRPEPLTALLTYLWLPFGFALAVFRLFLNLLLPELLLRYTYALSGIRLSIRGSPPSPIGSGSGPGSLFVCNHRTPLDPIVVSIALARKVPSVTGSADVARIRSLLEKGDLLIFPEGTTCREPFLLRFSALFAELSDRIVPVAVNTKQSMFYGTSVRGWKFADPYWFFMNPRPVYEVTFKERLAEEYTCKGGRTAVEVASHVERVVAGVLGFQCSALTWKDKCMRLGGDEGKVESLEAVKKE